MYAVIHDEMLEWIKHLDAETQWKVLLAYVNYQLYWVEPSTDDVLVYSIFKAKEFDLKSTKTKADIARENGKKWGRPRKDLTVENLAKTKKTQTKPNHNQAITQKNQENILYNNINNISSNNNKIKKENILKEKKKYLDFVLLTDEEYNKLLNIFWKDKLNQAIETLNNYIGSTGKKYDSHYFTIRKWNQDLIKDLEKRKQETLPNTTQSLLWTIKIRR